MRTCNVCGQRATWRLFRVGQPTWDRCDQHALYCVLADMETLMRAGVPAADIVLRYEPAPLCALCGKPCDETGGLHRACEDEEAALADLAPATVTWSGLTLAPSRGIDQ